MKNLSTERWDKDFAALELKAVKQTSSSSTGQGGANANVDYATALQELYNDVKKMPSTEAAPRLRRLDELRRLLKFSSNTRTNNNNSNNSSGAGGSRGGNTSLVKSGYLGGADASGGGGEEELTTELLLENQNRALAEQDRALDNVSRVIGEFQGVATTIGEEANLHSRLIDDLQDDVENGESFIQRERSRFELVSRRSNTKALWSTIMALLLWLVILIFIKIG